MKDQIQKTDILVVYFFSKAETNLSSNAQLFEGMKAYRGEDGRIRLFRPDRNMARMLNTAARSSLPTFDPDQMIECIKRLIQVDRDWVPNSTTSSLYIRPTFIGTEVSS